MGLNRVKTGALGVRIRERYTSEAKSEIRVRPGPGPDSMAEQMCRVREDTGSFRDARAS